jgi:citrate lyase subunit beta/citryl-CoA lyase
VEPFRRPLARSYLYVPGDRADRLAGAPGRGPDAVIADLEDAVAAEHTDEAVDNVRAWLETPVADGVQRWVRVEPGERGMDEIRSVFGPGLTGICLAKVGGPDVVHRAARLLDALEQEAGPSGRPTAMMPLIESAEGLQRLAEIAAAPRVEKLQLGELDLSADLGLVPGKDEVELAPYRAMVVLASAAAGLLPPVGPLSPQYRDLVQLESSTQLLKRSGFVGRAAIHPAQLPIIHATFTVTAQEIAQARSVLTRYDAARAEGSGVFVGPDGHMVDEAVVRQSRRMLSIAAQQQGES